jgi:predicted metal-dependent enzyme (double-stranded beta helix superfamily)
MSFSIDQFVADCLSASSDAPGHGGRAIDDVLARVVSDPSSIGEALGDPRDQPVFSTWFNSDELTVLHVVWPPTVELVAHNHMMWATIGLYGGREDNRLFRELPGGTLEQRSTKTLGGGDTIVLGAETVHAVANPSREWTGAIHVYGGDYFRDGRRMWADPDRAGSPFDVSVVTAALDQAAARAIAEESGVVQRAASPNGGGGAS